MKRTMLAALLFAAPAAAQQAAEAPPQTPPVPQAQLLNLSLMEALVSIRAEELTGVFSFVPEASSALAMADHLLHNRARLKRFLKKNERDLREAGGINEWDRLVFMHLMQVNGSGQLPLGVEKLTPKLEMRVSAMVLAPAMTLADINARRKR